MSPLPPRQTAQLTAALQRIKQAARDAAARCVDSLGIAALAAHSIRERDDFLAGQFELSRRQATFTLAFDDKLDERMARELDPGRDGSRSLANTDFASLSLVEDQEVEAQVSADRFGLAIQHACEWELRELDAYVGSLLRLGRPDHARNPLRPEIIGKALLAAVDAIAARPEIRKLLAGELSRTLASTMPQVYRDIVADLRAAGVQPVSLALRTVSGPGNDLRSVSGYETVSKAVGLDEPGSVAPADADARSSRGGLGGGEPSTRAGGADTRSGGGTSTRGGAWSTRSGAEGGAAVRSAASAAGAFRSTRGGAGMGGAGTPIGQVDAHLMGLIRRLAYLGGDSGGPSMPGGFAATPAEFAAGATVPMPPNLIYAHRDELRQASTGTLDHMVIDVVGSLFEQILADPKVPPQMARQIARLQLPVLRVALGDASFFSSRRHPVRRFVNRIASLGAAFDDLSEGMGLEFLARVRSLVQEIVSGDFDQMEVYERQLADLEAFIAAQAAQQVEGEAGGAAGLLERKEHDLLLQQRYMQQLRAGLDPVAMHDFLRDFLTQVWSQAIVQAAQRDADKGEQGDLVQRFKRAGRELVMSVQPKATPGERKNFLVGLPQLMKDLNEGMALVGWPEPAKKDFFSKLLPAHAESLKGQQSMRTLDYNLLVKQLDGILAGPLPKPEAAAQALPVLRDVVDDRAFSDEEARAIGLVKETAVDWDGKVDIDLSAEPDVTEVDINLDGLPPPEPTEPTRGASLADHVQLGFAYQMHLEGQWQKVRLTHVSAGRAFFVFSRSHGAKVKSQISMTARMLRRMCETGRMRAFENAYLLERATARARKQLAALKPAGASAQPARL